MIRRLIILALALAGATWLLRKGYEIGCKEADEHYAKVAKREAEKMAQAVLDALREPGDGEAVPARPDEHGPTDAADTDVDREPDEYENFSFNSTTPAPAPAPATPPGIFYAPWQR